MLVYIAQLFLDWLVRGAWRNPRGLQFPGDARFRAGSGAAGDLVKSGRAHWAFVFAIIAAVLVWFMMQLYAEGLRDHRARPVRSGQGALPASPRAG